MVVESMNFIHVFYSLLFCDSHLVISRGLVCPQAE